MAAAVAVATLVEEPVVLAPSNLEEVVVLIMQGATKVILKDSMMDMVKYLSISCNY